MELLYQRVYWAKGHHPANAKHEVRDPPTSGWSNAFVMKGEKRSTIFCPFSLEGFQVKNDAGELTTSKPQPYDPERVARMITDNWKLFQSYGWAKDYDTAAAVLKHLGAEVPTMMLNSEGQEDTSSRGGKEVADELIKPVKRKGKRGVFLQFFIDGGMSRSVRETMAQFSMTRSNALSTLFILNKDHGLGYNLVGDLATIELPAGVTEATVFGDEDAQAAA